MNQKKIAKSEKCQQTRDLLCNTEKKFTSKYFVSFRNASLESEKKSVSNPAPTETI